MIRRHFEHCFVFDLHGYLQCCKALPKAEIALEYKPWDDVEDGFYSYVVCGIHTGCSLPPSDNEFQLRMGDRVCANVTFDTFAAFFPRKWDGVRTSAEESARDARVVSYVLAKPVAYPTKQPVTGALVLRNGRGLPSEITITCGGVITRGTM